MGCHDRRSAWAELICDWQTQCGLSLTLLPSLVATPSNRTPRIQKFWKRGRKIIYQPRPHLSQMHTTSYRLLHGKGGFLEKKKWANRGRPNAPSNPPLTTIVIQAWIETTQSSSLPVVCFGTTTGADVHSTAHALDNRRRSADFDLPVVYARHTRLIHFSRLRIIPFPSP